MEQDVLRQFHMASREEALVFLKSLWNENPMPCALCGGRLDFLHKKAKKSNCDWKCLECGYIYKTMDILNALNET